MRKNHLHIFFQSLSQWIWAGAAIKVVVLAVLAFATFQATAATRDIHSGVVTRVVDGDTVWVNTSPSEPPLKMRIQGIDAPEICQAGGVQAQNALKNEVLGQNVTIISSAHDDYGRTVGTLYWQGQDVGRWLVANGHAWVYSFRNKQGPYSDDFAQAQAARRGIFSEATAEEPRLFRKRQGSCYKNRPSSYKRTSNF